MAVNETVCRDTGMALAIIRTITEGMKAGTQKAALESGLDWLEGKRYLFDDDTRMTREQREARIAELLTAERDRMTAEERQERAAFYLEGVEA
jgi:DNA-binding transcriptional MerR regulator